MSGIRMTARMCLAGALVLGLAAGQALADETPVVTDLRHGVHDQRVRLMLDVTPEPVFSAFLIADPDRLVVDFPALKWDIDPEKDISAPYIAAIRHGLFRRDRAARRS